jgi:hypothetical protein
MGIKYQNKVVDDNEENFEVEGEVDHEGELISALEELREENLEEKKRRRTNH